MQLLPNQVPYTILPPPGGVKCGTRCSQRSPQQGYERVDMGNKGAFRA